MLKLRRGTVTSEQPLVVEIDGEPRRAFADHGLVGTPLVGDEVIVNIEALELGLGSGGFDLVHVNLTRGLEAEVEPALHVMKLNYTSLQHGVEPIEVGASGGRGRRPPVLVLMLHGQLAPAAWAASRSQVRHRVGFVQTAGGALPGSLSRTVSELVERGMLCGHITAGPAYGGEQEAISAAGAFHAVAGELGWDAVIAGPGPGILGSATPYGHGGMEALDNAHAALALGLPTLLAARMSSGESRDRHRGLSHHAQAVLELLLAPVIVAAGGAEEGLDALRALSAAKGHELRIAAADLDGYRASGLPNETMGRSLEEDRDFFSSALAAGATLAATAPV